MREALFKQAFTHAQHGPYAISTALGEPVQAFVPHALPPSDPPLSPDAFAAPNHAAELALARLSGVSGLAPSVDWLLYSCHGSP